MRRLLAALAVVAFLGGCGSDDSGPSLKDTLTGSTWVTTGEAYQVYRDDGTYGVAFDPQTLEGDLSTADIEWGTWSLDDDVLTIVPDAASPSCADITGVYQLVPSDDGETIDVTTKDDSCGGRSSDFPLGLTRVES